MWKKNSGQTEQEILQNRFTAYLSKAIQRRRKNYLEQIGRRKEETLSEEMITNLGIFMELDAINELPLIMQLESEPLFYALKSLNERERHVFLAKVLDEKKFHTLAIELGMSYKGAATVYYRAVKKLKESMKGAEKNGF
ncbi:MAG: sigma-70 family RNA polymerase sigma factor [Butyrivibrio sp.]|nr:sigma-70 family RNA polymerase sigma factor [Butyrivibrio sp.]